MNRTCTIAVVLAASAVLVGPNASSASTPHAGRTLTVAKSGGQYSTIQAAANASQPGDTIQISAGTYQEAVKPKSGSASAPITYRAAAGAHVVIDGKKSLKNGNGLLNVDSLSWVVFDGITVTRSPSHGVYGYRSAHLTFLHCEVSSSSDGGMVILGSTDLLVDGCDIHNNNDRGTSASNEALSIGEQTTRFEVRNSKVHDNGEEGIDAKYDDNAAGSIHDNLACNNRGPNIYADSVSGLDIYDNITYGAKESTKAGIGVAVENYSESRKAQNIRIYNNVSHHNAGGGISFYKESSSSTISGISIVNNTIANNAKPGIVGASQVSGSGNVVRNTIFAANASGIGGPFTQDHNYIGDPGFVDVGVGNYHLTAGSPAIDTGSATGAPAFDLDHTSRPTGAGYDIGAYEHPAAR